MYGICSHASICGADQCETNPVHTKALITVDTVQKSVGGKFISELIPMGGCYFLANEEGLKWREETGGNAGGITIKTSNPMFVSSFFVLH